jgi:hypothetical protein
MIRKIIRWVSPPIIIFIFNKIRYGDNNPNNLFDVDKDNNPNNLFDGDDKLFKDLLRNTRIYGEYGCGRSTSWVLQNTSAKVITVDTSLEWVKEVKKNNIRNIENLNIHYSDCGEVEAWGIPINYAKREFFSDYTDYIWKQIDKPTTVLVDGRFRVCCFLTSLKYADEGAQIIFDDYTNRRHYHVVEKYVPRISENGRQCLFVVPKNSEIDFEELDRDITAFRHVLD